MGMIDGNGLPLGSPLDSADCAEVQLAQLTLDTIQVTRPRGRHKLRPVKKAISLHALTPSFLDPGDVSGRMLG